jgi:hypothetical protein
MRGLMLSMTTKPVVVAMTDVVSVSRSSAICAMPGVNMELASGLINAIRAMMPTFVSFSFLLHVFGFSRSSLWNSISYNERVSTESCLIWGAI